MSRFLDFSYPLNSYIAVFTFEEAVTSSSLYWLALRNNFCQPCYIFFDFLRSFLWVLLLYTSCTLLVVVMVGFLQLYAFSFLPSQAHTDSFPCAYPREVLTLNFLPVLQSWLAFPACSLAVYKGFHLLPSGVCIGSQPWGGGMYKCGVQNIGDASGTVAGICRGNIPSSLLLGFLMEPAKLLVEATFREP